MTTTEFITERGAYAARLRDIAALDAQIARLSAERAERVAAARQEILRLAPTDTSRGGPAWSDAQVVERELVTELATFTRRTEYRARTLIHTSHALTTGLPATLAALTAGTISWEHAEVIAKHAEGLPGDASADYDARLADLAQSLTPKQLDGKARAQVERSQPSTAVERAERAVETRRVFVDPGKDGMAYLTLLAPAPEIYSIADRAARLAKGLKAGGDPRNLSHLQVDVLSDLLLNGETSIPGATRGIRGQVHVTVPAMTLLGHSDEPAILRGYGPIDPATAAHITAEAPSWCRVLTDPVTGHIQSYGRVRYRPTAEMRDHVRLVHSTCVFPGCTVPSTHADSDHSDDFGEGGDTGIENLAPLCPTHHRVKHHTAWQIEQNPDDSLRWRSPAGYEYRVEADTRMKPAVTFTDDASVGAEQEAAQTEQEAEQPCPF